MLRSFDHREFPLARLIEAKRGRTISVCLPARNEAATVGQVVKAIRTALMVQAPLVDELIVVDDGSTDATAAVARAAGADVVAASAITPDPSGGGPAVVNPDGTGGPAVGNPDGTASPGGTGGPGGKGQASPGGKGQAMWKAVHVSNGDLVVFCDADIRQFAPHFITGLLGPLLCRDDVVFVKGFYERP
ncbi:MAG: glucosyl-3-phosphoglycerate synthase, partial [Acidimicrobiaceae bacterium]|nr:glucosyl-3-phosphoglycerate synthase [Acidimicrobiaceae bacterium]